jgi:hypothetical protein
MTLTVITDQNDTDENEIVQSDRLNDIMQNCTAENKIVKNDTDKNNSSE